jgi:hypothetical protein
MRKMHRKKWGTTKYGWSKAPGLKFTTTITSGSTATLQWSQMVETRAFSQEGESLHLGLVLPMPFAQVWSHQPTNWIKTLIVYWIFNDKDYSKFSISCTLYVQIMRSAP